MNHTIRNSAAALVVALLAALPAAGRAQARSAPPAEGMTAQDREMLSLGMEFSKRCSAVLEKWIDAKEVSEARLFSFLYYPVPKTDPPKFTTDWDKLSDRDILPLEEGYLARASSLNAAVLVDKNGYLPTHNLRFSQPLTGNSAVDLMNNRTKRIFNDSIGIQAARSEAPFILQRYQRDSGENLVDLAIPVYVKGQHWGAVRMTYRLAESH
jgi:methyl-accepting chemotaxis protein